MKTVTGFVNIKSDIVRKAAQDLETRARKERNKDRRHAIERKRKELGKRASMIKKLTLGLVKPKEKSDEEIIEILKGPDDIVFSTWFWINHRYGYSFDLAEEVLDATTGVAPDEEVLLSFETARILEIKQ